MAALRESISSSRCTRALTDGLDKFIVLHIVTIIHKLVLSCTCLYNCFVTDEAEVIIKIIIIIIKTFINESAY